MDRARDQARRSAARRGQQKSPTSFEIGLFRLKMVWR
jgi:hypothetical protein